MPAMMLDDLRNGLANDKAG